MLPPPLQAVVREWFAVLNRNLNTFSAFLLAVFTRRSYRATAASHAAEKEQAWHRWWTSASSTFNAIIEQEGLTSDAASAHGTSNGDSGGGAGDMWRQQQQQQQQQQQRQNGASIMRQRSERRAPAAQRVPPRRGSGGGTSPSGSSWWRFWLRRDRVPAEEPRTPKPELRRGYSLFELPSGFAVSQVGGDVAVMAAALLQAACQRTVLADAPVMLAVGKTAVTPHCCSADDQRAGTAGGPSSGG
jgi:hypothetical protein